MKIIIVGAGEIGYNIAIDLLTEKRDITLVENNPERIKFLEELGEEIEIINGNGYDPDILLRAGIKNAELLVAVADSDETNIATCYIAENLAPNVRKIARIRGIDSSIHSSIIKGFSIKQRLKKNDSKSNDDGTSKIKVETNRKVKTESFDKKCDGIIDEIINPEELCAIKIANLIKYAGINDLHWFFNQKAMLVGITISENNEIIGKSLIELGKTREEKAMRALIAAIIRNNQALIPSGEDTIQANDVLYIATIKDEIKEVLKYFIPKLEGDAKFVSIYGASNIGYKIGQLLENEDFDIKIIEPDQARASEVSEKLKKTSVLKGDLLEKQILDTEKIAESDVFVAATSDQESNIISTLFMKSRGVKQGITVLYRRDYAPLVKNLGIDVTVIPQQVAVGKILENIRKGQIISVVLLNQNDIEVEEFTALEGSKLVKKAIKDLRLPKGVLVIAVEKTGGEVIIPYGETIIHTGDKVAIIAPKSKVPDIQKFICS